MSTLVRYVGLGLFASAVLTGAGAFGAWFTGATRYLPDGGTLHTHADAAWVLGVLAVVLLVMSLTVLLAGAAGDSGRPQG